MESMSLIAGAGGWKKLKFKIDIENSVLRLTFHFMSIYLNHNLLLCLGGNLWLRVETSVFVFITRILKESLMIWFPLVGLKVTWLPRKVNWFVLEPENVIIQKWIQILFSLRILIDFRFQTWWRLTTLTASYDPRKYVTASLLILRLPEVRCRHN